MTAISDETAIELALDMADSGTDGGGDGSVSAGTKRGRRPKKSAADGGSTSGADANTKLERSRQSARECRARKKLRYQYLEDLVVKRERSVLLIKKEIEMNGELCKLIDEGKAPLEAIAKFEPATQEQLQKGMKRKERSTWKTIPIEFKELWTVMVNLKQYKIVVDEWI